MIRRCLVAAAMACAAPAGAQPAVNASFLTGNWGDTNECRELIEYRADGTYRTSRGDQGRWALNGNRLTMRARSAVVLAVTVINRNEIETSLVGSRPGVVPARSFRCRSRGRAAR